MTDSTSQYQRRERFAEFAWGVLLVLFCLLPEAGLPPIYRFGISILMLMAGVGVKIGFGLRKFYNKKNLSLPLILLVSWMFWITYGCLFSLHPNTTLLAGFGLGGSAVGAFLFGMVLPKRSSISSIIFALALAILSFWAVFNFDQMGKAASNPFFTDTNLMSAALVCSLLLLIPTIFEKGKPAQRILAIVCAAVFLTAIFLLKSRGAWLSLLALLPLLPLFFLKRKAFKIGWAVFFGIGLAAALFLRPQKSSEENLKDNGAISSLQSIADIDHNFSNRERLMRWKIAWRMAQDYPVTGIGTGCYPQEFKFYLKDRKEVEQIAYWHGWKLGAHSDLINLLAETGFVGLLLYLAFLIACFVRANRVKNEAPMIDLFALARYLALLSFLIHGSFNDLLSSPLLVVLFFGMLGQIQPKPIQELEKL